MDKVTKATSECRALRKRLALGKSSINLQIPVALHSRLRRAAGFATAKEKDGKRVTVTRLIIAGINEVLKAYDEVIK